MVRFGALLLLLVLVAAETRALSAPVERAVIVARVRPAAQRYTAAEAAGVERDFLAAMTPDDVARGVWALTLPSTSAAAPAVPALTDAQRASLAPLLRVGREKRHDVGELRSSRRAAETALLNDGAALVAVIGPERARALRTLAPQGRQR